ncbi:MAG TPA: 4'-phosphopantetheinyl transferase superfamily protein [Longimicrobiales bacterium]
MTHRTGPTAFVGNDVVDLDDPRCQGKAADARFLQRIFTREERERIQEAGDPDHSLWVQWAAKEAAFKVVSKVLGTPPSFRHTDFRVEFSEEGLGAVAYGELLIPFDDIPTFASDRIHVLAWSGSRSVAEGELEIGIAVLDPDEPSPEARLSERERASVHSTASAWVRVHAREHAARLLGAEEGGLEIVCDPGPSGRVPPRLLAGGEPIPVDVTLSHHGRFVAWALRAGGSGG